MFQPKFQNIIFLKIKVLKIGLTSFLSPGGISFREFYPAKSRVINYTFFPQNESVIYL
jgi:hypothetical protein